MIEVDAKISTNSSQIPNQVLSSERLDYLKLRGDRFPNLIVCTDGNKTFAVR